MNHYFFIDATGKQRGTFTPDELRGEKIRRDTLVWTQGMEQWKRADEVEELKSVFEPPYVATTQHYSEVKQATNSFAQKPKSWLIESLLVTLLPFVFCGSFLSLIGIIAIVYSTQVDSHFSRGDIRASEEASLSAEKWTKIALWIFVGWIILIIIAFILIFGLLGLTMSGVFDLMSMRNF
jgi:hypothetical protein